MGGGGFYSLGYRPVVSIYHFVALNSNDLRGGGCTQTGISALTGRFQDNIDKEVCAEYTWPYRHIGHRSMFSGGYRCMTRCSQERKQSRPACANIGSPSCEAKATEIYLFAWFKKTWISSFSFLIDRCKYCLEFPVSRSSTLYHVLC
jgi:hypothetical protein